MSSNDNPRPRISIDPAATQACTTKGNMLQGTITLNNGQASLSLTNITANSRVIVSVTEVLGGPVGIPVAACGPGTVAFKTVTPATGAVCATDQSRLHYLIIISP